MEEGKGGESEEGRGPREEFVKLLKKAVFNAIGHCLVEIEKQKQNVENKNVNEKTL